MNIAMVSKVLYKINYYSYYSINSGETSDRRGGAHMGFSECIATILNRTEQTCPILSTVLFHAQSLELGESA